MLISVHVQALTVYEWVNAAGTVQYSDQPHVGANKINIDESKWQQPISPSTQQMSQEVSQVQQEVSQLASTVSTIGKVTIVAPLDQHTFQNVANIHIRINVSPELFRQSGVVKLYIDGKLSSAKLAHKTQQFVLSNVSRGTHTLQVKTLDAKGNLWGSSALITIYVHRTHVNALNTANS